MRGDFKINQHNDNKPVTFVYTLLFTKNFHIFFFFLILMTILGNSLERNGYFHVIGFIMHFF